RILTRRAFDNAIAAVAASGGSTNAVLHLLALAREVGVDLAIDEIDHISRRTPLLCDLKPGGRFAAVELHRAGGIALLTRRLLDGGYVDGDAITVTGRTLGEECESVAETPGQEVVAPLDRPLRTERGLMIGEVAPEAAVGGPLAALRDGDVIAIDVDARSLAVENVDIEARLKSWSPPEPNYRKGVLARYAMLVGSASEGAILRP